MIRIIPFLISVTILGLIYWQINFNIILENILQSDMLWLVVGIAMVVPITMFTALRLAWLSPSKLTYFDSLKLILAASAMNVVLPSKMGDVVKGFFISGNEEAGYSEGLSLVMFEKISDLLALLFWCMFGLLYMNNYIVYWQWFFIIVLMVFLFSFLMLSSKRFSRSIFNIISIIFTTKLKGKGNNFEKSWAQMTGSLYGHKAHFFGIMLFSIFLWLLHLTQIFIFILSLKATVPFVDNLALTPIVILIGLMPVTFAGIGTRDIAFIYIFESYFSAATGAALGVFSTIRYIIPALFGIQYLSYYMNIFTSKE